MAKLPAPPSVGQLRRISPDLKRLVAGTELWRLHFRAGTHPMAWSEFRAYGPLDGVRFDHHDPPPHMQHRKILYAATAWKTCIAEVFQERRTIDRTLREPWLVGFALAADVILLDLTGNWPTAAGASMAINSGPRPRARLWSRAIYDAYPQVQGLWYASSMNANQPAVALYERAEACLASAPFYHRPLADPGFDRQLRNAAYALGYRLV